MQEISKKLIQTRDGELEYRCPGCGLQHRLLTRSLADAVMPNMWTWNGDSNNPTFRPSVLYRQNSGRPDKRAICHSWVTEGKIQFLNDSTHALAGQTVDMPNLDD